MRMQKYLIGTALLSFTACIPMQDIPQDPTQSDATIQETPSITMPVVSTGTLMIGEEDAPVTMLLFTNHDCAYCRDFEELLMPRLQTDFIATGKLRVQIIPLPLQKYPDSDRNAHLLLCGIRVGSGADVHRQLFTGRTNFPALTECLKDDAFLQSEMAKQYAVIRDLEVTLVPTYFINGTQFTGLPSYADVRGQITEALEQ